MIYTKVECKCKFDWINEQIEKRSECDYPKVKADVKCDCCSPVNRLEYEVKNWRDKYHKAQSDLKHLDMDNLATKEALQTLKSEHENRESESMYYQENVDRLNRKVKELESRLKTESSNREATERLYLRRNDAVEALKNKERELESKLEDAEFKERQNYSLYMWHAHENGRLIDANTELQSRCEKLEKDNGIYVGFGGTCCNEK